MSADPKPSSNGAARQIEEAISQLHTAQKQLRELQQELMPAGVHSGEQAIIDKAALWRRLESIDDRLHDALGALGD